MIVLAVVAGTLGTAEAMFLSPHDLSVVVMVCMVAAVVAVGFGCLLGRQLEASSLALRQAARSLGDEDGEYRSPAGPMTAELAALSRELAETSEKLRESRGREHALEQSRRQLVAWVSHDLRTPLAGLHAMAEALEDGIATEPDATTGRSAPRSAGSPGWWTTCSSFPASRPEPCAFPPAGSLSQT